MRPWIAALLLAGCASGPSRQPLPPPAPPGAPEVRAVRVSSPPIVDGRGSDPAWAEAPETLVHLEGKDAKASCRIRAVVHGGAIFFLIAWPDATEDRKFGTITGVNGSDVRHGVEYPNVEATWDEEDRVEVLLPIEGDFPPVVSKQPSARCDLWAWGACSTDPVGHAFDGTRRLDSEAIDQLRGMGASIGMNLPDREDEGGSIVVPWDGRSIPPTGSRNIVPATPTGSAADVLARGVWKDGTWTLEVARALGTHQEDDSDLSGIDETPLGLVVLGHPSPWRTGEWRGIDLPVPTVLRLLLPPPEPDDHQGPFPEPRRGSGYGR